MDIVEVEKYKAHLLRQDLKNSTVINHLKRLKYLSKVVNSFNKTEFDTLVYKLKSEGRTNNYLNQLIFAMRKYAQYADLEDLKDYPQFKPNKTNKATFSNEEIETFLSLCKNKKWQLFFSIMAYSGCRAGEVRLLHTQHVDLGRGLFILEDTKTHDTREVPIAPNLVKPLKTHMAKLDEGDPLFGGRKNTYIDKTSWSNYFIKIKKQMGLKRPKLSTHSFRHSFITQLLAEGVSIFIVMRIVGHKDIKTTDGYTHMVMKDMQRGILKHPLIAKQSRPDLQIDAIDERVDLLPKNKFKITRKRGKNFYMLKIEVDDEV